MEYIKVCVSLNFNVLKFHTNKKHFVNLKKKKPLSKKKDKPFSYIQTINPKIPSWKRMWVGSFKSKSTHKLV